MGRYDMEGGDGKMFTNPSLSDSSFSVQHAPKRLAAGLRPDPLGELRRTSKSLSRSGGPWKGTLCTYAFYYVCAIYNSETVFALLLFFAYA